MRSGIGYDVHPFAAERPLVLGGVRVPHDAGLAGHSDADVLTHALIDALLGAAALGDIGSHFPPDDEQYRDADSLELLRRTVDLVGEAGFQVVNVDATVIAETPKLAPHIGAMRQALARALGLEVTAVSVKATTANGVGTLGNGEGIAALAVVLVDST
jgi:2-C-methyl-D-erythritol 2,4-cyclodiphosphate synthase